MKRIGLFLGVDPGAGGMFQYAESVLNALHGLPEDEYAIEVAYVGRAWQAVLRNYRFRRVALKGGRLGLLVAKTLMAAQVPAPLARALTSVFNPIAWQLNGKRRVLWIFPAQDAISYQLRLPAITTVHDLMHRYEPHFPEVVKARRYEIREHRFRNLVATGCAVLVDSEVGRTHVMESYGADPRKIYPLPYVSPLQECHLSDTTLTRWQDLPPKFFFYPAQFWAHKNHAALISAAASLKKTCPDIHLVFTGGSSGDVASVRTHAVECSMTDRITFAGYVSGAELVELYRRARALVMPTFFGPTNIPPLEALTCGCPVAVSNIYAMPEQLGDAALYFNPRSVTEIAAVLERLWLDDELCERLKASGRRRLAAWNADTFAARLRDILDDVVATVPIQCR